MRWRGKTWCVPFYSTLTPICYNKEIFSESGLDPESPPKTWDEFLAACEKIKNAGYVPFVFGTKGLDYVGWLTGPLGSQNLDSIAQIFDMYTGESNEPYTDLKYSEWLYKVDEMNKKGYINDDASGLDFDQANELYFTVGEGAFAIMPTGLARTINEEILVGKIGFMDPPVYGYGKLAGGTNIWRKNIGITEWCLNKEVAADFLRFIMTEERAMAMYNICKAFSGSKNFDASKIQDQDGKDLAAMLERTFDNVTNSYTPFIVGWEGVNPAGTMVLAGELTPKEAAEFVQEKIEEWREIYSEDVELWKEWAETYR